MQVFSPSWSYCRFTNSPMRSWRINAAIPPQRSTGGAASIPWYISIFWDSSCLLSRASAGRNPFPSIRSISTIIAGGLTLTAIAGVVMNLIMAFLLFPIYKLVVLYVNIPLWPIQTFVEMLFMLLWTYSISFCVFNLIPLAPLDGWRVVEALNRRHGRVYRFFERYGSIILLILIAIHFVSGYFTVLGYIDILGYILDFAVNIVAWPITAFWGLIF